MVPTPIEPPEFFPGKRCTRFDSLLFLPMIRAFAAQVAYCPCVSLYMLGR